MLRAKSSKMFVDHIHVVRNTPVSFCPQSREWISLSKGAPWKRLEVQTSVSKYKVSASRIAGYPSQTHIHGVSFSAAVYCWNSCLERRPEPAASLFEGCHVRFRPGSAKERAQCPRDQAGMLQSLLG